MEKIKKYGLIIGIGITILMMLTISSQCRKIDGLKKKSVMSELEKKQSTLLHETIPQAVKEIAPLPEDKARLGDKLWSE